MSSLRKNVAGQHIGFQLVAKADGSDVTAGGAGNVTIDNGAQAGCGGTFTHSGSGQWDYAPTQAETNGTAINFRFTGTGAISVGMFFLTDNWDTTQPVLTSGTGANQVQVNGAGKVSGVVLADTVTTLTNLPAITANWLTAAGINAGALNGKGDWLLASSYTAPLSAAATATAVWTDTTGGDFTVPASIGKSIMNGVALGTGLTVVNLTNLPAITANWLTATGINAGALNGKGDWLLASNYTAPLSAAATATAVWTDTVAGDFTTGLSVGKSVMNGVALGTGLTINAYTGNTPQTGDAFARLGAPAGASTAADIAAVKTDTAAIKVQTDKFVFTVANQVDSNVITKTGFSLSATGLDLIVMSDLAGPPAATATVKAGLSWLFMSVQNDRKTTSTTDKISNNAGVAVGTATVSDDGTTYEKTAYA